MTFKHLNVRRNEISKCTDIWEAYIRLPVDILKNHNFRYPRHNQELDLRMCVDEEINIYFILAHFEDVDFDLESTPMAWILYLEKEMILLNCEYAHDSNVVDEKGRSWVHVEYDFEPFSVPPSIGNSDLAVKRLIEEALAVWTRHDWVERDFPFVETLVTFDKPRVFPGYTK